MWKVDIGDITPANLKQLQTINIATLPVRYTDKFYNDLLKLYQREYMQFAFWNGFAVGAVCARVETHHSVEGFSKLYIMTINVLSSYRRLGIATQLLNHVLAEAAKNPEIIEVYLHVQTSNQDAKDFYVSQGFIQTDIVKEYYRNIDPPDAFVLKKSLKEGHNVTKNGENENIDLLLEEAEKQRRRDHEDVIIEA